MGTQFISQSTRKSAVVTVVELKHASIKRALERIIMLECTHTTVEAHLKTATGEFRNSWHKFLPQAVLYHNTTYHASLRCEPTRGFHDRIPHKILDFQLGYNPNSLLLTD